MIKKQQTPIFIGTVVFLCLLVSIFVFYNKYSGYLPGKDINIDASRQVKKSDAERKIPQRLIPLILETTGRNIEDYKITKHAAGIYKSQTKRNNIAATFTKKGVDITPLAKMSSPWHLSLQLKGFGYENDIKTVSEPYIKAAANKINFERGNIAEWYINKPFGLEQGFTVYSPPNNSQNETPLVFQIQYDTSLKHEIKTNGKEIIWKKDSGEIKFNYSKLLAYDSQRNVLPSSMSITDNIISINIDDNNAIYPIVIDPILIQETLIHRASDPDVLAKYGQSVGIDGSASVIGSPGDNDNGDLSGSAYIHLKDSGGLNNWGEFKKITPSDAIPCQTFGFSVDISGDIIAVGANTITTTSACPSAQGAVYLFSRNQGGADNWGEMKKITASDGLAGNQFGFSVTIEGETLIVGAPGDSGGKGAAYVFQKDQGGADNWGEIAKITASDGVVDDSFGFACAISGNTAVVGAPANAGGGLTISGAAYIYYRDQGGPDNWGEVTKITASDAAEDDVFGVSVSIDQDNVVVGAGADDLGAVIDGGSAYLFGRNEGGADNWGQITKLSASDADDFDALGSAVVVLSNLMFVGSPGDDDGGNGSGAFYGSEFSGTWEALEKFTASDAGPGTGVLKGLGVFEVNDATGNRTIVSDSTIGTGNLLSEPEGIVVENPGPGENYLIADKGIPAIISVDPSTGNQTIYEDNSGSPSVPFVLPIDLDFDSSGDLFVTDPGSAIVIRIDGVSGNRSIVNNIGNYPGLGFPFGIAVESTGNVIVSDPQLIIENGTQQCFDCALDPDCIPPDCFAFGCVGCVDIIEPSIARINSSTGVVQQLADMSTCVPGRSFNRPLGIDIMANNNIAVAAIELNESTAVIQDWAVIEVNSATGACTVISDVITGIGPDLQFPEGIATLAGGELAVVDNFRDEVIVIDPLTGDRMILSGGAIGTGPQFEEPFWIALNGNGDSVVTDQGTTGIAFGSSIDISGKTAIIGAPGKTNLEGGIYIFQFCEMASPALTALPADQTGTSGQTLNYTVNVQNTHNLACASTSFTMSSTVPSGWSSNFTPASVNLNSGESTDVSWSVTSDTAATDADYPITAEATDDNEVTLTGLDNANYQVSNAGPVCGDGTCDAGEDCTICPDDCGACSVCGNGTCESGEDCNSCPADCVSGSGASCGNGVCEAGDGEDCVSCPQDCAGKQNGKPSNRFCCGDGDGQNPLACSDLLCGGSCTDVPSAPTCCGDLTCEGDEDGFSCEIDCGPPPVCGDGICNGTEDQCTCSSDCGVPAGSELLCTDGIDNDCDGAVDCTDTECAAEPACNVCVPTQSKEKGPRCSDGIDNDCDGLIDAADPDC